MSVFSEISDVLLLVVHSAILMVRGHDPNVSAYNFLEIYCVFLINMPIRGSIWSLFYLLLKIKCIQGFCSDWLPRGGAAGVVSSLASINHVGLGVFWGHAGKYFSSLKYSVLSYLFALFPPSSKLDATIFHNAALPFFACFEQRSR